MNRISFPLVKFIFVYMCKLKNHTFPSIWGGPGAFGAFDDDEFELDELEFEFDEPNVLVDVEFNADEMMLEFGVLLKQNIERLKFDSSIKWIARRWYVE